ncbi:predicted protein [Nematostella vectensis]|uniref:VWFD domain-containing protein n=1 Tax=Nematostella vectensis TaxID=45351 RepID=A7RW05_NEMVE|nr:predicted protein [Nematostella vectensis]|eukprot:XP_001636392.1 predicted protein [Nematostella vectensis]
MSAKLFGSEIVYLLLNNSMDAIKSLEEDGTIKLDKDWLGNQLKAGMNLNMNATDVLVDTMKRLPTTAGLPLTYQLTNGGVFRYNAYLQLTTSPLHNLIPWGRVAEETEGTFRECFSVVNNQMIKAYVSAGDTKMGFKFSTYGAFRCPVPFDEVKFETKGRDGKFIRKVVLDVEMNKQNTSFAKTGSEFHFFTYDKNGYWSKEMSKNRPPRLPGPLPGMGPETGQRLGQEGDGLGRLIGMFGGRGSPMGGNHPHPPGEPMGGRGGSSSGPNGADRGPAHSRRRQIHNGGIPGTSGSGPRAQGMGPQEGVRDASPIVCREAWNDSLALCMDNSKNTHMWFYPGGRPVENINLEYKNSTDADEPYWEYELEIEVDDAGRKHLDKYDIKITVPRPPSSPPPSGAHPSRPSSHREVISIEAMRTLKPRSILPDGRTPKNPEWTACVKLGMNPKERQLQVHAGMGQKDCSVYSVNMSVGYTEKNADPGIDIAISWNSLPDNLEMMTCPAKQIMKQMGKVPGGGQGWGQPPPGAGQGGGPPPPGAGQGGGPPPPGAGQGWGQPPPGAGQGGGPPPPGAGQGGGPPPPGAGQGWGQPPPGAGQGWGQPPPGAGQGGPPPPGAGQEGPPPPGAGQGGGPPPPGAGQGWGLPPPGSGLHLYCFTSFNLSLVMANGTKLQVFGVPTPETLVFEKEMPFFKPIHNKLKGFVKYETCNAIRATDEITTFDKKQFTYRPTTGCPHVLAKDCSKKELFTVFMNVTAESKKELTVVVKDRKGIGHVFVITPEMTVMHDGSPLQMKPIPGEASTSAHHIPRLCKVTKSAEEVVVTCDAGLTVITNAEALQVKVSPWYFHYMCGMCGNFDWRPTDDSRDPVQRVQDLDHAFAASWLVPGENCKSGSRTDSNSRLCLGCKVVQRPLKEVISGKYCVATNALQCAPGCQATRSTNTTLPFACVDQSSPLVAETDKNFRDENFGAILNAFKDKVKSAKYSTIVHYDCNCDKCPLK